jgi:hypothetical protein
LQISVSFLLQMGVGDQTHNNIVDISQRGCYREVSLVTNKVTMILLEFEQFEFEMHENEILKFRIV